MYKFERPPDKQAALLCLLATFDRLVDQFRDQVGSIQRTKTLS